jgi:hypothetical protein
MAAIDITFAVHFYNYFSSIASFLVNFCAETQMYHHLINTCREDLKTYAASLVACRLLSLITSFVHTPWSPQLTQSILCCQV